MNFTATSNHLSSFVPLEIQNLIARQGNGTPVPKTIANNGRVVVIGSAPLLEAFIQTNGQRRIVLYGIPETPYTLESTTNFTTGVSWKVEWQGPLTNVLQAFDVGTTNQSIYYRLRTP